jgi:hypothetical protein
MGSYPVSTISKQYRAIATLISAIKRGEKFKPSEISYLAPDWDGALNSLFWLQQNEQAIKAALKKGETNGEDAIKERQIIQN